MINKILIFLFFTVQITFSQVEIKSLKTYQTGNRIGLPINDITIEFDIKTAGTPNLNILFRFCDKNWEPYESTFLTNYGYNTERQLNYSRFPVTIIGAEYHFKGSFPNDEVNFPFSGKWKFYITDMFDPSIIFAEGKFFVLEDLVPLYSKITKDRIDTDFSLPVNMNKTFRITTSFRLEDSLYPSLVDNVEIIENWKLDYPIIIDTEGESEQLRYYEWDANNKFDFIARNVRPGNEYREANFLNYKIFIGPKVTALRDKFEVSRFYDFGLPDLNGSSYIVNYKEDYLNYYDNLSSSFEDYVNFEDEYAQYLDVEFTLRAPPNLDGDVYLVGSFNDWQLLPEYKMEERAGLYTTTIQLKRGVYDYQYVVSDDLSIDSEAPGWYILEGNFWETNNQYLIMLYYNETAKGGYDRVIGYKLINSEELWKN